MENEEHMYREAMFKRIVNIQLMTSATRNQYTRDEEDQIIGTLDNLRVTFLAYDKAFEAILNAEDANEFKQKLEVLTTELVEGTTFPFGTVRKCVNLVLFLCSTCNAFVSEESKRTALFQWLEVPIDNQVFNYLKNQVSDFRYDGTFTIINLTKGQHQYLQEVAEGLSQSKPDKYPTRYYIDFAAWRAMPSEFAS